MAFTDQCDIFGAVHEDGINLVVRHVMRKRPSLFNYATQFFTQNPRLLCVPVDADREVIEAGDPLFSEVDPIPVFGAPIPLGLNFCVQLTDAQIDFHPGNVVSLPAELGTLPEQRLALHMKACVGLDCPNEDVIQQLIPQMEAAAAAEAQKDKPRTSTTNLPRAQKDPIVLPTEKLLCFCLEVFAVAHAEWGEISGSDQQWLKIRLDGLEIVDLQPAPMEELIECYIKTVLRLGILPGLVMPMEKLILNITELLAERSIVVGDLITLEPTPAPAQVAHNPAIEENQLKAFVELVIVEGGA